MSKFIYFLLTICTLSIHAQATIVEAPDLKPLEQALVSADEQTLVLLDVDDTLIKPSDQIFHPKARPLWENLNQSILKNPEIVPDNKYPKRYLFSQMLLRTDFSVVDPKIVSIINDLKKRNITTIGFTKMHSGLLGAIQNVADWRIDQLKKHQIDFSDNLAHLSDLECSLPDINVTPPYFKDGILFANKLAKGPALAAFLEFFDKKPKKIIFLDDRLDYLQSVEKALEGSSIEFIGFHYTAVANKPCTVNEQVAEYQFLHLALNGIWLTDDEALDLMSSLKSEKK
jgi:hypothetical protein